MDGTSESVIHPRIGALSAHGVRGLAEELSSRRLAYLFQNSNKDNSACLVNYKNMVTILKRTMLRVSIVAALILAFSVASLTGTASAITGNYYEDGVKHPYVCLVIFEDVLGHPAWRTTGILLSPTVVLTAGHGTDGAVAARIWIEEGPIASIYDDPPGQYPYFGTESYEGKPYTMPGFGYYLTKNGLVGFITNDVGIVVLSEPVPTNVVSVYGDLPNEGAVNSLAVGAEVTFVGYGVQYQVTPKNNGGPYGAWTGLRERFCATARVLSKNFAINNDFLKCSSNAAQGKGGTAFGDSGGPVLNGDTDTVLALTSFGANSNCAGASYYFRVDQPDVLEWINSFLRAE
jgi:V8-like Glu-specific endopeptidase